MAGGGSSAAGASAVDRAIGKLRKQSRLLLLHPSASVRLRLHDGPKWRDAIKVSFSRVLTIKEFPVGPQR